MSSDLQLPEQMTPAMLQVLGMPNFLCGPIAHVFRSAGHQIKYLSEDEQAFVLHRFLKLAIKYGDDWHKHSVADVEAALAEAKKRGETDNADNHS